MTTGLSSSSSCGACKFLRRKCTSECVFAPYFSYDQASNHFAAVHKVFGASNVSKLLLNLAVQNRAEAALSVSYQALARMRDPIYGCVAHIFALQQQVASLKQEIDEMANLAFDHVPAACQAAEDTSYPSHGLEFAFKCNNEDDISVDDYLDNQNPPAALVPSSSGGLGYGYAATTTLVMQEHSGWESEEKNQVSYNNNSNSNLNALYQGTVVDQDIFLNFPAWMDIYNY